MRMNKNLFPIICVVLLLIGWATGLIYFTSPSSSTDVDVSETADKVGALAKEIYLLQYEKQKCKDSLSFLQTIADYNGVDGTCSQNDSLIEKKKIELGSAYEFEYMRTDIIVWEMKEEKKFQEQVDYIENGTGTAVEKLITILSTPN